MGSQTGISWCDSTVNPTTGCDGCELWHVIKKGPCYSGPIHEGRLSKTLPHLYDPVFTNVRLAPGRMAKVASLSDLTGTTRPDKPWLDGLPRMIFVGDMGDIFSKAIPFEYLNTEIIDVARSSRGSRHIWMLLTKRPSRMVDFARYLKSLRIEWPSNVWVGTSVTDQKSSMRIKALLGFPGGNRVTRYLSLEPLIEYVGVVSDISPHQSEIANPISLAIIGGESAQSGHEARPFDVGWARKYISEFRRVGIAPFVKQLGSNPYRECYSETKRYTEVIPVELKDSHGGDWDEWTGDLSSLRVREFPSASSPSHVASPVAGGMES